MESTTATPSSPSREGIMKQTPHDRAGAAPVVRAVSVLGILSASLLAGCTDLLTPENPSEILAENLKDPKALPILLAGVAGDFNYMYSYAIVTTGHFANELWHTGSQGGWRELNRGIADPQGQMGTVYDRAVKANWVADNAASLIVEAFPDAQTKPELARARIYAGFAQLLLADNFCAVTINGGPALTPATTYEMAATNFTESITIATAADHAAYRLQALAGRARANLMLKQYQAARDDAAQIPGDWRFQAIYSINSSREENFVPSHTIARFRKEGGVDPRFFNDPRYATDPRLNFINMGPDTVGEDRIRQFVQQTKYTERNSPANIVSWQEARLIEAEAELELGNTGRAIVLIDEVRAAAPLPPYDGPTTKADVLKQIFFERSVELFLEAKHIADLRRSGNPILADRADCGPISWVEQNANPNLR
jgi:starch-binding outer membrane protein, SusD/RagB family